MVSSKRRGLANLAFARSLWPWAATAAASFEKLPFRFQLAYVLENRIDQRSYTDSRDRLRERLAYAESELSEARDEQLDVEGVLTFAEHVLMNAGSLWVNATSGDKRTLQRARFPEPRLGREWIWNRRNLPRVQSDTGYSGGRKWSGVPTGLTPFCLAGSAIVAA